MDISTLGAREIRSNQKELKNVQESVASALKQRRDLQSETCLFLSVSQLLARDFTTRKCIIKRKLRMSITRNPENHLL